MVWNNNPLYGEVALKVWWFIIIYVAIQFLKKILNSNISF